MDCGSDARIANEWIAKYSGAAIAKAMRDPDGGSRMSKDEGGMLVTVKLSANTSDKNKSALRKAGLKWNGRRRSWIGTADAEAQARLHELFGDRVQTQTQLTPSTGRDRSPAAATAPQDAAVGDTITTDAPVSDHAGPAGASGPAAAPTTPPIDQVDTAVMRAGGAVVVGTESAAANAGDAPVASAPVPPPVGRKMVDAGPAAARPDRARARALGAGRVLGRSNRRLALYGASPADTQAVPTSAGQVGCVARPMAVAFPQQHNGEAPYQRYQLKCQQRPPGTTQGHQSTTKRPVEFPVTPHALKLLQHKQRRKVRANPNVGSRAG